MKRFLLIVIVNFIVIMLILEVLSTLILSSYNYFSKKQEWYWIKTFERSLDSKLGSDTLVLGCSVARQLFPPGIKDNYKVTTAVDLMATSYIFSSKAALSTPGLKTIIIITVPNSFSGTFENEYSYNEFVKPYYVFENFRYIDGYLLKKIAQRPFALMAVFNSFKIMPISDFNYRNNKSENYSELSEFATHFLIKLRTLAKEKNINLVFIPSPVNETFMKNTEYLKPLQKDILQKGFGDMFKGYFENIVIYHDSCFIDGLHFKQDYLSKHREEIVYRLKL